jgi:hypothetical protein
MTYDKNEDGCEGADERIYKSDLLIAPIRHTEWAEWNLYSLAYDFHSNLLFC